MSNEIRKTIHIQAPRSRVWRALIDHEVFGEWFRAKIDLPFVVGQTSRGSILSKGYEHLRFIMQVRTIQPMDLFVYAWHPFPSDPNRDYEDEEPTLVTFTLTEGEGGTVLTVVESGFDRIPAARREEAFRMNDGGWSAQLGNIARYVTEQ